MVAMADPWFSFDSPLVVDFSGEDAQDNGKRIPQTVNERT